MGNLLTVFILFIAGLAVFLQADFALTVLYLLGGVILFGQWWSRQAMRHLEMRRQFATHAFQGEAIPVRLEIHNPGLLPIPWLQLHESLNVAISPRPAYQEVFSLPGRASRSFEYSLEGRKRGYFPVGPLTLASGDLFGLLKDLQMVLPDEHLTVYPRIIPLHRVDLPSRSPLGALRTHQPVFEDPARVWGKREYTRGDSLRRIDWKASAASDRLQVKQYEPSIALEAVVCLDLHNGDYASRSRFYNGELAITTAASLASWITGARQAVGLLANGRDSLQEDPGPQWLGARRGRAHLMHILEVLARLELADTRPLTETLSQQIHTLPWGTTLIVITPVLDDALFESLFQARRQGLNLFVVGIGPVPGYAAARHKAQHFGIPLHAVQAESDLDQWCQ
ncbi:MAG TPA: DUF58 domain-containing protein [Anaerolineales bacterium]|nr:DUF58 domain-containing protein [Anaerolineales bacterium]